MILAAGSNRQGSRQLGQALGCRLKLRQPSEREERERRERGGGGGGDHRQRAVRNREAMPCPDGLCVCVREIRREGGIDSRSEREKERMGGGERREKRETEPEGQRERRERRERACRAVRASPPCTPHTGPCEARGDAVHGRSVRVCVCVCVSERYGEREE